MNFWIPRKGIWEAVASTYIFKELKESSHSLIYNKYMHIKRLLWDFMKWWSCACSWTQNSSGCALSKEHSIPCFCTLSPHFNMWQWGPQPLTCGTQPLVLHVGTLHGHLDIFVAAVWSQPQGPRPRNQNRRQHGAVHSAPEWRTGVQILSLHHLPCMWPCLDHLN